jgi:aspartyl-tRNA(Asn)/glutamyl-tRNA(Gln) amidotransferase subunit A
MAQLHDLTAQQAAAAVRAGQVSPVELVEHALDRIARLDDQVGAFVTVTADAARSSARAAERAVRAADDPATLPPLLGVPTAIKDLNLTAGVRTTFGSAAYADYVPEVSDAVTLSIEAAGMVSLGKTNTPEFGSPCYTEPEVAPPAVTPWDRTRMAGGSSGGAAAAVAAGLVAVAQGSDGGGSIRIPASCCGLVGLKPTLGAVPADTTRDAFGNNIYAGPLARTVTDAAVMHAVLSGPSAKDPWSYGNEDKRQVSPSLIGGDLSATRIGYIERTANPRVAIDVRANTRTALDTWSAMGADVEEVSEPIDWIEYEGRVLYQANFAVFCAQYLPKWQNRMDPVVLAFMQRGDRFTLADFRNAQFARTQLFRKIQSLFERYDFLVTPTNSRTALPVGFDAANDEVEVDGVKCGITRQGWTSYQYPFNLTGHPALSLPSGFGTDGLPTAVQIVGKWGAETDVLRLGALLEQAHPWAQHRPPAL